jgi:glucosamine-6-phosphate deaminase
MKIQVFLNYDNLCEMAANEVVSILNENPASVLGLPTGGTPIGMYYRLIEFYQRGFVRFSQTITFNLDEYVGISPNHPQSYHYYMKNQFFNHIDIKSENIHIPYANVNDVERFCRRYEQAIINCGGIDLLILGLGKNGHIGFNEPGSQLTDGTRMVTLADSTIKANARFFDCIEEVPRSAVTMGISTILKSKKIILLASGNDKTKAVSKLLKSEPSSEFPATFLKLHHDVTLFLDEEAIGNADED